MIRGEWENATLGDYQEIRNLISDCDAYRGFKLNRDWGRLFSDLSDLNVYIYKTDNKIISTFSLTKIESNHQMVMGDLKIDTCYMSRSAVLPEILDKGLLIGGVAFLKAIDFAKYRNFQRIICEVNTSIESVYHFLISLGYSPLESLCSRKQTKHVVIYKDLYE